MSRQRLARITVIGMLALYLSCSSGGGQVSRPAFYIWAEIKNFTASAVPPNFKSASVSVYDSSTGEPVSDAIVTVNGVKLANVSGQVYEGDIAVAEGEPVTLAVSKNGQIYKVTDKQFNSFPAISAPLAGLTWPVSCANTIMWTDSDSSADTSYTVGVLDAVDGTALWSAGSALSSDKTSYVLPANSVTAGDRIVYVGISRTVPIQDAFTGSSLKISGFSGVSIRTTGDTTLTKITIAPSIGAAAKGSTLQLTANGSYCMSGSTNILDITSSVLWSSSSTSVAIVSNAFGTNGLVSIVENGTSTITASLNGLSGQSVLSTTGWTLQQSGTAEDLNDIAWTGTQYVAVGGNSTILTSLDGVTWTIRPISFAYYSLRSIVWSGSQFVAVGNGILTSPDGITWTIQVTSEPRLLDSIVWTGTQFVAVGLGVTYTSSDGISWSKLYSATESFQGIAWSGTQFVVVGSPGIIRTSPDSTTWTSRDLGDFSWLSSVIWSGAQFCIAGNKSATSSDGVDWSLHNIVDPTLGPPPTLRKVIWVGDKFVAVSDDNAIWTSPDCVSWTSQPSGIIAGGQLSVVKSADKYVAVGRHGNILTFP